MMMTATTTTATTTTKAANKSDENHSTPPPPSPKLNAYTHIAERHGDIKEISCRCSSDDFRYAHFHCVLYTAIQSNCHATECNVM